jgi:hypothetical protein
MGDDKTARLIEELDELVGLLAQQSDSRATNLDVKWQEKLDRVEEEVEELKNKKWDWFQGVVLALVLAIGVVAFETWRDGTERISVLEATNKELFVRVESLSERAVLKYALIDALRLRDKERRQEIKELIKEFHEKNENIDRRK